MKSMKSKGKKERGQILVESMVAATVGVIGILGILSLLTNSIAKSREVSERFIATFLASEGIEIVRGFVDENYTNGSGNYKKFNDLFKNGINETNNYRLENDASLVDFISRIDSITPDNEKVTVLLNSTNPDPLLFDSADNSYGYRLGDPATPFTRVVEITTYPGELYKVKFDSIVFWNSKSGPRRIVMEDYAYDWRHYDKY